MFFVSVEESRTSNGTAKYAVKSIDSRTQRNRGPESQLYINEDEEPLRNGYLNICINLSNLKF